MSPPTDAADRLAAVRERIERAARRAGRDPSAITLVGASKVQPLELLRSAHAAGLTDFGENRVQEAEAKRSAWEADGPPEPPVTWHLLGPLQSNKASTAAALFDVVHSLDRLKIARYLDRATAELERDPLPCFLEVNQGGEASKHGFVPEAVEDAVAAISELPHVRLVGLMTIPPPAEEPEGSRRWFAELAEEGRRLAGQGAFGGRPALLSMGMSGDFEVAVEEGATHVRVGSALFGPRER